MNSFLELFSHLYIEKWARGYPLTKHLVTRYAKSEKIIIDDYKSVFSKGGQRFQLQKKSPKLILAVKKENYLYPGSEQVQTFGHRNFFYNTIILNCLYNCDYCYLQGMYPSANIVVFVNTDDYFTATNLALHSLPDPHHPLYLAISYDTDLLAMESLTGLCREWIDFSRPRKNLIIEIRTKSANFNALSKIMPHERAILAWTLSPAPVVRAYEKQTPSLESRLKAARRAIEAGWRVRLCFDPIIRIPDWEAAYAQCLDTVFSCLPAKKIQDVSVGVFRMNGDYFKKTKKQNPLADLLYYPYERDNKGCISYPETERREMTRYVGQILQNHIEQEKIEIWT